MINCVIPLSKWLFVFYNNKTQNWSNGQTVKTGQVWRVQVALHSAARASQSFQLSTNLERISFVKLCPNDRNMSTQHIATLLGATCCAHLAALLRYVGCCRLTQVRRWSTTFWPLWWRVLVVDKRTDHSKKFHVISLKFEFYSSEYTLIDDNNEPISAREIGKLL